MCSAVTGRAGKAAETPVTEGSLPSTTCKQDTFFSISFFCSLVLVLLLSEVKTRGKTSKKSFSACYYFPENQPKTETQLSRIYETRQEHSVVFLAPSHTETVNAGEGHRHGTWMSQPLPQANTRARLRGTWSPKSPSMLRKQPLQPTGGSQGHAKGHLLRLGGNCSSLPSWSEIWVFNLFTHLPKSLQSSLPPSGSSCYWDSGDHFQVCA